MSISNIAAAALNPTAYLIAQIADYAQNSILNKGDLNNTGLAELKLAADKQDLEMRMAEAQARVAQELAIAKRIELAEEVEMEEFYDVSIEGNAGFRSDEKAVTLGMSGSGRRVTKRIYKFRGSRADGQPEAEG